MEKGMIRCRLEVGQRSVPLLVIRHPLARRYLLRLRPDGTVKVTIPNRGTISAAKDFALRNQGWLEQQFQRFAAQPKTTAGWQVGTEILFRGETVRVASEADGLIRLGTERMKRAWTPWQQCGIAAIKIHRILWTSRFHTGENDFQIISPGVSKK
jgi:predicted metal-dependent hydrolase